MKPIYLLTTLLFLSGTLIAQDAGWLDQLEYREVGPMRGGRVTTVTGVRAQPNVFYMGASGGGVWKSEDYGMSWKNVSDGYFASPSIGAIRVAESDPNVIYVGTGSDGLRSNVIAGKGVYKSIDGGQSWQHTGLGQCGQIGAVEIHPRDHNIAFVAAIGQAFQPNPERGIYRTRDGGQSWEKVLFLSDTTGFADLEFMPSNPNIVYAAAWRGERKPWTIISGGDENGIYKSLDGGDSWERIGKGLPKLMGKIDLAVCPADSKVLYALVEAPGKEGGLYRSKDQGRTFQLTASNSDLKNRPFYYTNIEVDPTNPDIVYAMALRFIKSEDGGKTWRRLSSPHGDNHDLWINPDNTNIWIQANDGGANVSLNAGETWSTQFNQPTAELYQVEVDNQYPYWLYAGQQDNYSTISVPSLPPHSHQAGSNGLIMNTGGCETGPAVPHPLKPHIVYSNCKGRFSVFNKQTGQEQAYDVGAAFMYGHNPKDLKFRFQRVSPIHISPHDPDVVYHTSQFVHKTEDGGKHWVTISPDLTAFEPDKQVISGSPITRDITGEEFYSTIYAIRESPLEAGVIWVGANDGPVHVSKDGGEHWNKVTPKDLGPGGRVDAVEPSPHTPGKAFIAVLRYQLGDWTPYIYKTENYGKSWKLINKGIPNDYPVRVIREDPEREGLLFAGTEYGLFVSFDDGDSWQEFQNNLPITPITDLKIHRSDLVLSTMGRGFWIMDNMSTLQQLPETLETATLFRPKDTYRYRGGLRSSEPSINYPTPTVLIDYFLPKAQTKPVRLSILDPEGKVVQAYSSEQVKDQGNDGSERDMATNEIRFTLTSALKNEKGLHRFRWNMRARGPWNADQNRFGYGPYALPGIYTLRLETDAGIQEQAFDLKMDPRVEESGVTSADLMAQMELEAKVSDLIERTNTLHSKLQNEHSKLTKIKDPGPADEARIAKIEGLLTEFENSDIAYPQQMLLSQVNYLYRIVIGADQRPGQDAFDRYQELVQQVNALEAESTTVESGK